MMFASTRSVSIDAHRSGVGLHRWRVDQVMGELSRGPLKALRAVILLGGSVRSKSLARLIGRSLLDLPIGAGTYLGDHWREQCTELFGAERPLHSCIRLLLDSQAAEPKWSAGFDAGPIIRAERDPLEYRGTGGVLRDVSEHYSDDDLLLVASAGQLFRRPLLDLARELAGAGADAAILTDAAGTPGGLMLVRCGCLAAIPAQGFVDMKEQALPLIARRFDVQVIESESAVHPLRTCSEYIEALRQRHAARNDNAARLRLFDDEHAGRRFSIVESGARVHPGARIHDSVILDGAQVEKGAIVVRSLVCGGTVVRAGRRVVDSLVSPATAREVGAA